MKYNHKCEYFRFSVVWNWINEKKCMPRSLMEGGRTKKENVTFNLLDSGHLSFGCRLLKLLSACDGSLAGRIGNVTKSIRTPGIQDLSLHFNLMNAKHGNAFAQMHTKHIMNCTVISRWTACQIVIIRLQNNTSIISKIN